ncbi:IS21-like element helper ATPase IstB [Bradyrhizobium sp. CB82]|nr:IS21-like element helper ATPase IstB [Bradyrhizobium sp. CB82]WFU40030.1 IS21-like element helper ATPase IstB [Bradyrhizobium sp. CB82]
MSASSVIERVKTNLVSLKMPRALEILDVTLRGLERGEISAVEAIDALLTEELTMRENRRIKMAVQMAKLSAIKTLAGFDFAFQPSLDKNRVLALAGLQFINRAEAVHLIGPPGTGKTHLSLALGVEAVKAGRSVYFSSLADIVASLAKAERDGALRERIRYHCRFALLIVDEIGYLPVTPGGGNLFFQLVNARYEKGAMILTSNRGFAEWGVLCRVRRADDFMMPPSSNAWCVKYEMKTGLHLLVRIENNCACSIVDEPGWQRQPQFAPRRLLAFALVQAHPKLMQLRLAHDAGQAQQQAVVVGARIVKPLAIRNEHAEHAPV